MYSSGYSKYSPEAKQKMQYRTKSKSCGYYMRIVFFFSSLIQSLIIVSLVLFLIYGKKQDSASTSRIQGLEESFSRLSIENVALRQQRKNLTNLLNTTLIEKARNDFDLVKLRHFTNISLVIIQDIDKKLQQCSRELLMCKPITSVSGQCPRMPFPCTSCGGLTEQLKARLELVESNFTQTTQRMRMEMDQTTKERDTLNLEVIRLRRDKSTHEKEVDFFRQKCKNDFAESLSGVTNVSKAFLEKIDTLFPTHIAFQLTCAKQREHLEQIRTNCSSLSREVEDKFQRYLNSVGQQVSSIQAENSRLKAENWRLSEDYRWCSQNRTGLIQQHRKNLEKLQGKHDEDKEGLLMDKMKLNGEKEVLVSEGKYKRKVIEHLTEQLKKLNMSCMSTTGSGGYPVGPTSRGTQIQPGSGPYVGSQPSRTGLGVVNSAYNKPVLPASTGMGTSIFPSGSGISTGLGLNKPASTGGALSNYGSTGSNPSLSSSGTGSNQPALSGRGSPSTGSSFGSAGSNPSLSSSGTGSSKPTSSVRSSSGYGSSPGSTGSMSKSGSSNSGLSWFGMGSSNSGQSKTGSGTGKGTSNGNSYGGTGSSFGAGRTNGLGGGQVTVAQHLQDLQRIINPTGPEEKQDLSRMLG